MADRDTRDTIRPTALELSATELRRAARGLELIGASAQSGLDEADRVAHRHLTKVVRSLGETALSLYAAAANLEAQ